MLNSAKLKESLAAELDKVSAVHSLCEKENREPTADEQGIVNAAIGEDGKGGEVAKIKAKIVQAEAFEAEVANAAAKRQIPGVHHSVSDVDSGSIFARVKVPAKARSRQQITSFKGPDAEQQCYAFGRMIMAVAGNNASARWCDETLGFNPQNAMSEGSEPDGGFMVPPEFDASLIRLVNDYGVARRVCNIVPMRSDTKQIPRRTGGLTAYAIGEISAPTATSPTGDLIQLVAKKFGVLSYYSRDLDEDSAIAVGNMIAQEMALAFANKEDSCLFLGDGTSTYNGIVGIKSSLAAGSKYTALAGNTAFSTLDLEDFEGMLATLPSYAFKDGGPEWYIHRSGWATSMLRLAAAAGGNTTREIAGGMVQTQFLGYPVNFVEVANSTLGAQTSTTGLCYVGNLRQAVNFGDRRGVTVDVSRDVAFTTQQVAVLGTERFDIVVHDKGTASVAGSIVQLATPSS